MSGLPVTATAAALLGLIFVALSVRVVLARFQSRTDLGDGGQASIASPLFCAVRGHANFTEYVPLSLLLIGGAELSGAPHGLVLGLASALVLARLIHPIGIGMKAPNAFRAGGVVLTLGVLIVASLTLLWRLAM